MAQSYPLSVANLNLKNLKFDIIKEFGDRFLGLYSLKGNDLVIHFTEPINGVALQNIAKSQQVETYDFLAKMESYHKRKSDGVDYFNYVSAKLLIDYENGVRDLAETEAIEIELEPLTDLVTKGHWITAQYKLTGITFVHTPVDIATEISNKINSYANNLQQ